MNQYIPAVGGRPATASSHPAPMVGGSNAARNPAGSRTAAGTASASATLEPGQELVPGGCAPGAPLVGVSTGEVEDPGYDHPVLQAVSERIRALEPDYPMPTTLRDGEAVMEFDAQGHYLLPALDNAGGTRQSFPRASHIAKTLDDSELLHRWQMHRLLEGLVRHSALLSAVDPVAAAARDYRVKAHLDQIVALAHAGAGTERASKFGSAVHAWIEAVDLGFLTVDEVDVVCRAHVRAFQQARDRAGLTVVPEYVERVIHNSVTGAAGRFDQLVRNNATGELEVLDVKTSRAADFSALGFLVQLGQYATAERMLELDGSAWTAMPKVSTTRAWVAHVPSIGDKAQPDKAVCRIIPVDLTTQIPAVAARTAMGNPVPAVGLATILRAVQSNTKRILGDPAGVAHVPFPSVRELVMARLSIAADADEMGKVYTDFRHAWTEEYTAYGQHRLRLMAAGLPS